MPLPYLEALGHGIHAVDTGLFGPRYDAAYLLVSRGRAAFIDTGTNHALPRLLAALGELGIARTAVDWVIPTHVHLDHAGGAGALMAALPCARMLVHPRGAPHMIDPSALYAGALAVYGEAEMQRSYGRLLGVPADRVDTSSDGMVLDWAGRRLMLIHTPGHARHHHCIWDEDAQVWFSGDTFGSSRRDFDVGGKTWAVPITPPNQFEPDELKASMQRMMSRQPRAVCMTHYGRVDDLLRLQALLVEQIDAMVALAERHADAPARRDLIGRDLAALYREQLARHGLPDPDAGLKGLALDIDLNTQGLDHWLTRRQTRMAR